MTTKNKTVSKAIIIVCAVTMLLSVLTGCGTDNKQTSATEITVSSDGTTDNAADKVKQTPLNELPETVIAPVESAIVKVNDETSLVSNELTVAFKSNVSEEEIMKFLEEYDAVAVSHQDMLGEYQIRFSGSGNSFIEEIKDRVAADARVEAVYYSTVSEAGSN